MAHPAARALPGSQPSAQGTTPRPADSTLPFSDLKRTCFEQHRSTTKINYGAFEQQMCLAALI